MVKLFVAASGLAVASASEECGTCWTIDAVTGLCKPKADKVKTFCGSDTMSMQIDSCLFEGTHDYASAYIGADEQADGCQVNVNVIDNVKFASASHGIQACGATMEYVSEDSQIVFKSVMHIPSSTMEGGIFITKPIDWTFSCTYDTSYDITADEMSMDGSAKIGEFAGFGQFDLSMSFYTSETFDNQIDAADAYSHQVGKSISFGVQFNHGQQLTGLSFAPTSCEVVNVEDPSQIYQLWDSTDDLMCDSAEHPVDFTVQQSPNAENLMKQFFGLSYTGFAFDSVTNDIGQQLLKCHVEICHDDTEDSMCKTGCFEESTTEVDQPDESDGQDYYGQCGAVDSAICRHSNACQAYPRVLNSDIAEYDTLEVANYYNYYHEHYLTTGDTIFLSRLCTKEWKKSGEYFSGENALGCDDYAFLCNNGNWFNEIYTTMLANEAYFTQRLHMLPDGSYATILNCPQCSGCTEGAYDAPTFEEIECVSGSLQPDGNYYSYPKEDDSSFGSRFW